MRAPRNAKERITFWAPITFHHATLLPAVAAFSLIDVICDQFLPSLASVYTKYLLPRWFSPRSWLSVSALPLCSPFFPFLGALPRKILDSPKVNAEINNNDARSDNEASDKGVGDTFYHSPALAHSSASPELHSLPIHCLAVRIGRQSQHSTPRTNVPQSNPHPTPRPRTTTAPRPKTSPVVAVLPCQTNHLSLSCGTCAASRQAAHAAAEQSRARRAHRAALLFASRDPGLYTYSAQATIVHHGLGPAWPLAGFPSPGPSQHAFP